MTFGGPGTQIHSDTDLFELWQVLVGDEGYTTTCLWLVFLDAEQHVLPTVMPIDDLPPRPELGALRSVAHRLDGLAAALGAGSVAVLLSRPGRASITADDVRWARALYDSFAHLSRWPVHLATPGRVQRLAPDDLRVAG